MWLAILFAALWSVMFGLVLLMIAMTPTTVATPNSALLWRLVCTGALSGVATLVVAGAVSLFT